MDYIRTFKSGDELVLAVLYIFLITTNSPLLNSVAGQWCLACCFSLVYCDFKMLDEASARLSWQGFIFIV